MSSSRNSIRTARSRNPGEYLLRLLITSSSQGMKPPKNPRRFNILDYIVMFHNSRRLHSTLDYSSTNDFE